MRGKQSSVVGVWIVGADVCVCPALKPGSQLPTQGEHMGSPLQGAVLRVGDGRRRQVWSLDWHKEDCIK